MRTALSTVICALALTALTDPPSAAAAEVGIVAMADPGSTVVEIFDVRTLPSFGPPYHPGRIWNSTRLPGNVVSFRLDLHLRWKPRPTEYWVQCSPNPLDQSIVMVFAGEMPNMAMPFAAVGRFVGQMGKCRVRRRGD